MRLMWRKSSKSEMQSNCVEVASTGAEIALRDSKDAEGPHLQVEARAFAGLLTAIRRGRYDL